jgi:hypothetical protein
MPGPEWVDLYLEVDPAAATVEPRYRVTTGGAAGPLRNLGSPEPIPSSWVSGTNALAVGLISTSAGPGPVFPATWDLIEVQTTGAPPTGALFSDGFESGDLSRWTDFNRMVVQQQEVLTGSWAARATSTAGTTAFTWKQLDPAKSELYVRTGFKLISKGSSKVVLGKLTTGTGGGILAPLVTAQGKLGYRNLVAGVDRNSSVSVTPGWHQLEVRVVIAGASSQTEVWLDGARIGVLSRTESLGTAPIGRLYIGETASGRLYDVAFDDVLVNESPLT